jgi:hypothetical protein
MPGSHLEQILGTADAFRQDAGRLRLRGLYVDVDRRRRIRRPSEITGAEVSCQLARARQVASPAGLLRDPGVWPADPPAEATGFSRALARAFVGAGGVRSPEAAAAVALNAIGKLHQRTAASGAG